MTAWPPWISVVLLLLNFGFGVLAFVALVITGTVAGACLATPFMDYDDPDTVDIIGDPFIDGGTSSQWVVDTLPEALVTVVAGVLFRFVALNVLNGLARIHAR